MNLLRFLRKQNWFKTFLFYAFRIIPVQKKKVIFCNFSGKRCSDSPRSICDLLQKRHPGWDFVWLTHPKYNPPIPLGTRSIPFSEHSIKMIYELATAKVWVDSHTKFAFTRKRKKQFYMETWHGGIGLKKVEGDAAVVLDKTYLNRVRNNSKMADIFLSNSDWCSKLYKRAFWFNGEILEYGLPRNDMLVNRESTGKVRSTFGISESTKILLYAPTFRADERTDCYSLDTSALLTALREKTECDWKILIRLHPVVMQKKSPFQYSDDILDATLYANMQELLVESDALVSDYSSCLFDYSILKRPTFLFATDVANYMKDRNFYFDIHTLPFPLAEDSDTLCQNIRTFNMDEFLHSISHFLQEVGLHETGTATAKAAEQIESWVKGNL